MKRSGALARRTPLARSAALAPKHTRTSKPKRRNTGPTAAVRNLIEARSGGWCEWPGCWLVAVDVHHRLSRKAGGRRGKAAESINQAANLLHACRLDHDRVTSPVGADRDLAREMGWLLYEGEDALTIPAKTSHGYVLLLNNGTYIPEGSGV